MEFFADFRPVLAAAFGVAALLLLIMARRLPAFPALLVAALLTGLAAGLSPDAVLSAIQNGMGGVLGFIAVIVGLGALLSVFLEAGGGAKAIALQLLEGRSSGMAVWLMGMVGIVIAIPVFFDVGLILLMPVIVALARRSGGAPLLFGLPLLAGLAAAHAFVPPTPGPIAVADILGADIGWVILFGLVAAVPAMMVGGPVYARIAERAGYLKVPFEVIATSEELQAAVEPGLAIRAVLTILTPLVLIVASVLTKMLEFDATLLGQAVVFIGHPFVALLIACGMAYLLLRPSDAVGKSSLQEGLERAFEPTAAIILVTGAGGAFKQVLIDTKAGAQLAEIALASGVAPMMAAFLLAALVRVMQGSATVAMLTAAGLVAPIAAAAAISGPDLALMTIAIAAGASVLSHVNDSGFWLVSRYFGLTVSETLKTWTVASTLVGLTGFLTALLISFVV